MSATPATSPSPTVTPTPTATATAAATPRVLSAAAGRGEAGLPLLLTRSPRLAGTPSFAVTTSAPSTNAGVPLTMTVQALTADGTVNTAYAGTVKFTSTDAAFAPGAGYRYTFTTADAGQHVFPVTFNTAGSPTVTVTPTITGTSPAVAVAETYLSASFAAGTVVQGASVNLTVQARDGAGTLVTGYRGTVQLASTYNGVQWNNWGSGVTTLAQYAFTATDGGSHTFTPKFTYAGDQTVTVTDTALAARTVTTSPLTVTNSPAGSYSHGATPSGVELPDGSIVMAFLGIRGRLSVRRNVGTVAEPAWRPGVLVREANAGGVGADSPSLVRFGTTLALFHTYTDGTYFQAWLTTSTDDGATWSTPVKLTSEAGHIQRLQAVVSGGTVYLFWSRQDTNGKVFYRSSTDLTNWTAKAQLSQSIGVPVLNTTSNFGLTRLASGTWLLGWEGTSAVNEGIFGVDHSFSYPTVHVATSPDLVTWSSAVEMNLPYSQSGSRSVALAQEPGTNLIYAVTEQWVSPGDVYIARRTSTDGANWSAAVLASYDPSLPANGSQGYTASMPALVPGSMVVIQSVQLINSPVGSYGTSCWSNPDGGQGVQVVDIAGTPHRGGPVPLGDPKAADCPTCAAHQVGYPVNALTGHESAGATDLVAAAQGRPLTATRVYRSSDGYDGLDGPFGYGWSWSYGTHAITHAITHADGSVTIVEGNGWRSRFWKNGATWTAGPSVNATLAPAAGGGYTLTRHDQSVWTFDGTGRLTAVADANGNTQTLTYVNGRLSTISAAGGRTLTVTAGANGHITAIAGPGGLSASYTYDANGNLATATAAAGATTTYTYDGLHQLLTVVDGNTHTVETNTYGTLGRVMSQKDAANQVTSFRYGEQGTSGSYGPTAVTDPRGNVVQYANDGGWRLTVKETFQGCCTSVGKVRWSYTANGDVASVTDGRTQDTLHVTSFTYDSRGNALTMVQDAGNLGLNLQSTFTYDSLNDLLTATDPLGHTTTYTYDSHGNRLTATDALNHTTSYAYDPQGQLTSVTDATSRTTSFGYSPQGDLTSITVPGGAQWTLGYDGAGRLTSITDPNSHTTTLTVDGLGRVTSVTNALNQTTTVTYDAAGNRTAVTDANTHRTSYGYDALNRLTSVTDALNGVTSYGYDGGGNLTSVTNALGKVWSYTYDAANRLATAKDPLGNTTTSTYDGYGNVTQLQKPDGTTNRFVYHRLNRLTGVDLANNGSLDLQYAYDTASRRTSMIDGTGTTTYAYDNANRLTSVTAPTTGTVSYGYDNANRRTSLTYPSSHQVTYGYTNRGELQTVTDWTSGSTTYTYDPAGRLTGIALPNGVSTTLGYDLADRLTSITHATGGTNLEAIQYVLDVAGNRTSMTDSSGTTTWGYDALDRLTSASYPNGDTVGYGYDAVGNRTSLTVNGATTTSAFDAANRLTASGSTTYTYDANGNQTGKTAGGVTTTYTYDALDRLTGISGPESASYSYNGDGLRVSKTVSGTTTTYAWDVLGLPVVLSDGTEYVWGHDLIAQITAGGTKTYAHADGLGSIRLLTDSTGTVVGTQQYDAFGAARSQTGTQLPFGYAGEQADPESGLVYLRARYLDPASGRFQTQDPLAGAPAALGSAYPYADNNPINGIDPLGLRRQLPGPLKKATQAVGNLVHGVANQAQHLGGTIGQGLTSGVQQAGRAIASSPIPSIVSGAADYVALAASTAALVTPALGLVIGCAGGLSALVVSVPAGCAAGLGMGIGISRVLLGVANLANIASSLSTCISAGANTLGGSSSGKIGYGAASCVFSVTLFSAARSASWPGIALGNLISVCKDVAEAGVTYGER